MLALLLVAALAVNPTDGKTLVFNEEFNRYRADVWSTRGTAYTEASTCARADPGCVRTNESTLVLAVRRDPENPGKYLTGHIGTQGKREFDAYGYFEAKVRFPSVPGVLCGWWLQTAEDYIPGQSEIDVAENYGNRKVHHTIWWRELGMMAGEFAEPAHIATDLGSRDAQADLHRYGVLWDATGYTFFIDGAEVGRLTEGLSAGPKFLALSIKIPDYLIERGTFDPDALAEYRMRVKWVRVWQ